MLASGLSDNEQITKTVHTIDEIKFIEFYQNKALGLLSLKEYTEVTCAPLILAEPIVHASIYLSIHLVGLTEECFPKIA